MEWTSKDLRTSALGLLGVAVFFFGARSAFHGYLRKGLAADYALWGAMLSEGRQPEGFGPITISPNDPSSPQLTTKQLMSVHGSSFSSMAPGLHAIGARELTTGLEIVSLGVLIILFAVIRARRIPRILDFETPAPVT